MRNWNRTGKIKAIILGVLFIINIIMPTESYVSGIPIHMILGPLIFGLIAIPIITIVNRALFSQLISNPSWNDNPITTKHPLRFFHFAAFFFLVTGLGTISGTALKFQQFNVIGLTVIFFGLGILGGIFLTIRLTKQ
jgi:hypothetical protein